jgi:hypothetical protein
MRMDGQAGRQTGVEKRTGTFLQPRFERAVVGATTSDNTLGRIQKIPKLYFTLNG